MKGVFFQKLLWKILKNIFQNLPEKILKKKHLGRVVFFQKLLWKILKNIFRIFHRSF